MCDPLTLIGGALGLFGMFMGQPQQPDPPKVETPAIAAPTSRTPGATVRLGNGDADITNDLNPDNNTATGGFVEQRVSGNSLGNLGRSGLAL